jgi:hypothetical protein
MQGHSVDDDLIIITLVAFPPTSRKTKSTIKAGREEQQHLKMYMPHS